ncbi:hypothetical protein H4W31_006917 [Plantactinospora soyae]|uniref:Uncharacterized protein n=1 Tax=Plantactinospora soyae TaxID=1544732 RepID=A0A927R9B9_9ACTN|nr:hypothetical protein [Plantactinospora soyae]
METINVSTLPLILKRLRAEPGRVTALDRMWHAISAVALPCDQSRDLISRMVKDL